MANIDPIITLYKTGSKMITESDYDAIHITREGDVYAVDESGNAVLLDEEEFESEGVELGHYARIIRALVYEAEFRKGPHSGKGSPNEE